jgi:hypothetical protein
MASSKKVEVSVSVAHVGVMGLAKAMFGALSDSARLAVAKMLPVELPQACFKEVSKAKDAEGNEVEVVRHYADIREQFKKANAGEYGKLRSGIEIAYCDAHPEGVRVFISESGFYSKAHGECPKGFKEEVISYQTALSYADIKKLKKDNKSLGDIIGNMRQQVSKEVNQVLTRVEAAYAKLMNPKVATEAKPLSERIDEWEKSAVRWIEKEAIDPTSLVKRLESMLARVRREVATQAIKKN